MTIRKAIMAELKRRRWSHYQLVKELAGQIPARTVYAYLSGERDLASERASMILKTLGLKIRR